jgi:RNA polymerase sigma-70 factor (ECF subfamily)
VVFTVAADVGLAELCEREHPVLVGALGLYLGDRAEAEDIAQEALIRLIQRWPLDGVENPGAWAMRVAFNLATSSFRRRMVHRKAMDQLQRHRVALPADTAEALAVRRAVLDLPERQRQAIVLRYFADLPVRDTARVMKCPEGTVKTLVHQAIKSLRRAGLEVTADD